MEERTVFHKIRDKEASADIVYEDGEVIAFRDIHPRAITHILFVPKLFVASIFDLTSETAHLPGLLVIKAKDFAERHGMSGYKLEFHVGRDGGQIIDYLHLHFLSQQELKKGEY